MKTELQLQTIIETCLFFVIGWRPETLPSASLICNLSYSILKLVMKCTFVVIENKFLNSAVYI